MCSCLDVEDGGDETPDVLHGNGLRMKTNSDGGLVSEEGSVKGLPRDTIAR